MKPLIKTTAKISVLFLSLFVASICYAQTNYGQLKGKIKDAKNQSILDYATLVVKQDGVIKAFATSDENGDYTIANLPAGEYTLEVSYVGYSKYVVYGIKVTSQAITFFNCELKLIEYHSDCLIYIHTTYKKIIDETDNKRTIQSDEILNLPMRD